MGLRGALSILNLAEEELFHFNFDESEAVFNTDVRCRDQILILRFKVADYVVKELRYINWDNRRQRVGLQEGYKVLFLDPMTGKKS